MTARDRIEITAKEEAFMAIRSLIAGRKRHSLMVLALAGLTFIAGAASSMLMAQEHETSARLVQIVQGATRQYADVNVAVAAGYGPFLGCVSGPDHGAMGTHYVNGTLLNGQLDPERPQALIYEPSEGKLRLVGVEFIVDKATWDKSNSAPPVLEGQSFQFVSSPNRYNIPAFYELHVWAWRENPLGAFVDWNTRVSCAGQ
jgi:hypothetical protein